MISEAVNANEETVIQILHEVLNMKKICVPQNVSPVQKLVLSSDCLERLHEEPELMKNIITCNETEIFQYDVESKQIHAMGNNCIAKNEESQVNSFFFFTSIVL